MRISSSKIGGMSAAIRNGLHLTHTRPHRRRKQERREEEEAISLSSRRRDSRHGEGGEEGTPEGISKVENKGKEQREEAEGGIVQEEGGVAGKEVEAEAQAVEADMRITTELLQPLPPTPSIVPLRVESVGPVFSFAANTMWRIDSE